MKINYKNIIHLLTVVLLFANFSICLVVYRFFKRKYKNDVCIYGHRLNGNLKAIYSKSNCSYLTINYNYYKSFNNNPQILYGLYFSHMIRFLNSKILIVSHGVFFISLIKKLTKIKIINVWHGLPNQLLDEEKFNKFDENWLFSEFQKELFINPQNLDQDKLFITGYGRLDNLIIMNNPAPPKKILIANTWSYDNKHECKEIFSINNIEFVEFLESTKFKNDYTFIIKPHINYKLKKDLLKYLSGCKNVILSEEDDAEVLINESDILLTDWSSIIFDFIYTNKQAFLFQKVQNFRAKVNPVFHQESNNRIGSYSDLKSVLDSPYKNNFLLDYKSIQSQVFDKNLIANGTKNYIERIDYLLNSED